MRKLNPAVVLLLGGLLAACTTLQPATLRDAQLQLLPVSDAITPVLLQQKITWVQGDTQLAFIAVLRLTPEHLRLLALNANGQALLDVHLEEGELNASGVLAEKLPVRDILATLQFAHWPVEALRSGYPAADAWALIDADDSRELSIAGNAFLSLQRQGALTTISNWRDNYTLMINTLKSRPL